MKLVLLLAFYIFSAHAQQTIDKLNTNQLKLPKESSNRALILDGAGQVKSSSTITDTELGYLEGLSDTLVNLLSGKANDSDVVKLTGNQSVDGIKTFTGKLVAQSTVNGSTPCPVMTESQRDLFTPVEGDCVYNSDTLKLNVFDGSIWKDVGGAGGISLWITLNSYIVNDIVIESDKIYRCVTAHTSDTFAADFILGYWVEVSQGLTSPVSLADGGTGSSISPLIGSLVYVDSDSFEQLIPGTPGQILQIDGSSIPSWTDKTEYSVTNSLETTLSPTQVLLETGNKNILTNPSFESSSFDSGGWVNSAGSFTENFAFKLDGAKSARLVLSSQTMSLTQSSVLYASNFADGVQGLASVRVKSDVSLKVCSVQAGIVSSSNCVDVQANNKWGLYKVPFILGATSNGISIASTGNVTGTVFVDDAFVGAVDLKADVDQSRIAGESYFAGTTSCEWSRASTTVGAFGAVAACPGPTIVEQNMGSWQTTDSNLPRQTINNLPAGKYKATFILSQQYIGTSTSTIFAINDGTTTCESQGGNNGTAANSTVVSCTFNYASSGNRTFEVYGASLSSTVFIANNISSPRASTKFILEYFGSGSVYSSTCGANCVDMFSAAVSNTGVVSGENADWINGNCTWLSSDVSCNFNSGIFTVAPNCWLSDASPATSATGDRVYSISTTSMSGTNTAGARNSQVFCQKTGADFNATRTIIGQFNELMVTPNVTKPKTCYYAFGGASATLASPTECTSGTCTEVVDTCGAGSPPTWASTSLYQNLTFANGTFAANSLIDCKCTAWDTTSGQDRRCEPYFETGDNSWATDSLGGYRVNVFTVNSAGAQSTAYVQIKCEGQAP